MDAKSEKVISLAKETQFAPNGIVSRTLLRTPVARVVLFGFSEGQELTEHTSTQHALVEVLSGECEFSLAGKPHNLKAGDFLHMPPNLPHAVKATKQFSMLLTLFKPARVKPTAPAPQKTVTTPMRQRTVNAGRPGGHPRRPGALGKIMQTVAGLKANEQLRANCAV